MPWLRFLRGSHGATVASLADSLNGRSPRHITPPCSDLALPLQRERNRSQQAMIAWQRPPSDHGRTSCRARATGRYAANDGARNVDLEMLSRFERHHAAPYGAAAVPCKTIFRQ